MKPIQIISQDLFDKVRSRFTNLEMGDETGSVTIDPADARFFDFDFVSEGTNLGRVSISINDGGSLKVYYSQGITENQDTPVKKEWFGFLREMRLFAMRRLLRFDTRDIAKTNLDKNDFQHLAQTQGPKEPEDMTTMNESKKKKQGVTESLQNPAQEQINQILRSQAPNGNYEDDRYLDWIIGPESIQRLVQQTKLPLNQVRNYVTAFCQNPNPEGVAEGKANNDLRDNVLAVLTNIYNGSVAGEYMIDDIADELNDYFDQVQQSNDPILQKAYSFMVDNGQEAEDNPKLMARIAQKAISLLSQQGVAEGLQNPAQEQINQILRSQAPNGNVLDDRYLDWIIGPESIQRLAQQTKLPLNQVRNYVTAFCQNPDPEGIEEGEITKTATGTKHRSTAAYGGTEKDTDHLRTLDKATTNKIDKAIGVKFKKQGRGLDLGETTAAGSVSTVPAVGGGTLFGGNYSNSSSPFKKKSAKKESMIKR